MTLLKSTWAIVAGFLIVAILSTLTDFILETIGFFPPLERPLDYTTGLFIIATLYRCAFTILGGYITAWLAPNKPMRHVIILGSIGTVIAIIGVFVSWNISPEHWYPIALVITALPCTWYGGKLKIKS